MNFFQAVKNCFVEYCTFRKRASRSEFWYWTLFCCLALALGVVIDMGVFDAGYEDIFLTGAMFNIVSVIIFFPSLAVTARRLHDVNRSAWWVFLSYGFSYCITLFGLVFISLYFFRDEIMQLFLEVIGGGLSRDNILDYLYWPQIFYSLLMISWGVLYRLFLIYWLCKGSDRGENCYGLSSKDL
jgi:uncharacterized membrane protein YhaH (DUF805 family)